jgi:acyl carrier protein
MHNKLKQFIFEEVLHSDNDASFSHDDDLLEAGLESMGIMRLVLFIEQEFSVTLPDEEIEPDNVRTINRIAEWIDRHR